MTAIRQACTALCVKRATTPTGKRALTLRPGKEVNNRNVNTVARIAYGNCMRCVCGNRGQAQYRIHKPSSPDLLGSSPGSATAPLFHSSHSSGQFSLRSDHVGENKLTLWLWLGIFSIIMWQATLYYDPIDMIFHNIKGRTFFILYVYTLTQFHRCICHTMWII